MHTASSRDSIPSLDELRSALKEDGQVGITDAFLLTEEEHHFQLLNIVTMQIEVRPTLLEIYEELLKQIPSLPEDIPFEDRFTLYALQEDHRVERARQQREQTLKGIKDDLRRGDGVDIRLRTSRTALTARFFHRRKFTCKGRDYSSLWQLVMAEIPGELLESVSRWTPLHWVKYKSWVVQEGILLSDLSCSAGKKTSKE